MKTALRIALATFVLAAVSLGAHAQSKNAEDPKAAPAPKAPPPAPKAPPAKMPPKAPVLHLACPETLGAAAVVEEHVRAKLGPSWKLLRGPGRNVYELTDASLQPAQGQHGGLITCRYGGLNTSLQAALPKGCEPKMLGPWGGGAGMVRLPTGELFCQPLRGKSELCAVECASITKR